MRADDFYIAEFKRCGEPDFLKKEDVIVVIKAIASAVPKEKVLVMVSITKRIYNILK